MAVIKGNGELSLKKLASFLGCKELEMADDLTIRELTKAEVGFASPVGMSCKVILDNELKHMVNFVTGSKQDRLPLQKCQSQGF
jgi:prolyl-tRNA synthetase